MQPFFVSSARCKANMEMQDVPVPNLGPVRFYQDSEQSFVEPSILDSSRIVIGSLGAEAFIMFPGCTTPTSFVIRKILTFCLSLRLPDVTYQLHKLLLGGVLKHITMQ